MHNEKECFNIEIILPDSLSPPFSFANCMSFTYLDFNIVWDCYTKYMILLSCS